MLFGLAAGAIVGFIDNAGRASAKNEGQSMGNADGDEAEVPTNTPIPAQNTNDDGSTPPSTSLNKTNEKTDDSESEVSPWIIA